MIATALWFYESFFVVYKLLYLTINRSKWGNEYVLVFAVALTLTCERE